jgi:hypothetical protein
MCGETAEGTGYLIPVYAVFCGIAVIAVALRLFARVVTEAYFWWDDLANFLSFVRTAPDPVRLAENADSTPSPALRCAVYWHEHQRYLPL